MNEEGSGEEVKCENPPVEIFLAAVPRISLSWQEVERKGGIILISGH